MGTTHSGRVEPDANGDPSEMGGVPTLGGLGVLRSEDEVEFEYVPLGDAKLVFAGPGPFQQQDMIEHDSATLVERTREVLIECIAKPDDAAYFVPDTGDLVMITIGPDVIMSYEVATVGSTVALPPFERRYVLNPRDDLAYAVAFHAWQNWAVASN